MLLRAAGVDICTIARQVGMSRRHIYKWLYRFAERGLAGLDEKPNKRGWHRRLHGANDAFEEP